MMIQQLVHEKGHFYVCGDVSMAEDVCKTLKSILQQNGIEDPDVALIKLRVTNCTHFNPICSPNLHNDLPYLVVPPTRNR